MRRTTILMAAATLAIGQLHQVARDVPDTRKAITLKDFHISALRFYRFGTADFLATFPSPLASNCSVTIKG